MTQDAGVLSHGRLSSEHLRERASVPDLGPRFHQVVFLLSNFPRTSGILDHGPLSDESFASISFQSAACLLIPVPVSLSASL